MVSQQTVNLCDRGSNPRLPAKATCSGFRKEKEMKKFMTIMAVACSVCACDSKVTEEQKTGTVVSECPTGTTASGGSGGSSTTDTLPPPCVADSDCPVPANCILCPGSDVCTAPTATCIEGTCQVNTPSCPGVGGAGQGGTSAGGSGGTASAGGAPAGGAAPVGGSAQGGAASGGSSSGGGGSAP